jgi:hypothetical protein
MIENNQRTNKKKNPKEKVTLYMYAKTTIAYVFLVFFFLALSLSLFYILSYRHPSSSFSLLLGFFFFFLKASLHFCTYLFIHRPQKTPFACQVNNHNKGDDSYRVDSEHTHEKKTGRARRKRHR